MVDTTSSLDVNFKYIVERTYITKNLFDVQVTVHRDKFL